MFHLLKARINTKRKAGFTLLELVVVIVVLGVLAAIAIPSYAAVIDRSKTAATTASAKALFANAKAYSAFDGDSTVGTSDIQALIDSNDIPTGLTVGTPGASSVQVTVNGKQLTLNYDGTVGAAAAAVVAYALGDTGPGGGKVFYVASTPFTCGPTLNLTCTYLEAAPTTGASAWTDAEYVWSGNTADFIPTPEDGLQGEIGRGYINTLDMVTQANGGSTPGKAGTISRAYRGPNNLSDWFLPSFNELGAMFTNQVYVNVTSGQYDSYWSSTGANGANAYYMYVNTSYGSDYDNKTSSYFVRPVRAF